MLIFVKGHYLALIASGQKTTTIRPWKTCRLVPGDTLSFNGRLRVTVTKVTPRTLGELTEADAHADGFVSVRAFRRAFQSHYPTASAAMTVWVLRFRPPAKVSSQSARARTTSASG